MTFSVEVLLPVATLDNHHLVFVLGEWPTIEAPRSSGALCAYSLLSSAWHSCS